MVGALFATEASCPELFTNDFRLRSPFDFTLVAISIAFAPKLWVPADLKEGAYTLRVLSRITAIDMPWPPHSLSRESELSGEEAELLISRGAFSFEGLFLQANHTLIRQPRFYATVSFAAAGNFLEASSQPGSTLAETSLVLSGQPLEQPSMAQCFGALPGTITLNRYIDAISGLRHPECLPKYKIQPRATDNLLVLQRLHYLMRNGWDKDVSQREILPYLMGTLIGSRVRSRSPKNFCICNLSTTLYGKKEHLPNWKDRS